MKLEEERRALAAFVSHFDSLGLSSGPTIPTPLRQPTLPPAFLGPTAFASRHRRSVGLSVASDNSSMPVKPRTILGDLSPTTRPVKQSLVHNVRETPNLLDADDSDFSDLAEVDGFGDAGFERGLLFGDVDALDHEDGLTLPYESISMDHKGKICSSPRAIFQDKENILP